MRCEFEEKQYGEPLNNELSSRAPIYAPGQVFENKIGIDAALFSKNPKFWRLWQKRHRWLPPFLPGYKTGVYLEPELWDYIEETLNSDAFPQFKFNLFMQHKRPEFISSSLGKEYKRWRQPYFRYDLTPRQQDILYRLEQKVSANAIVVYGCPTFWRFRELWSFSKSHRLVENSNFVQPHDLKGHERYTFINSRKKGKAFSEPVDIERLVLLEEIYKRLSKERIEFRSNTDFIHSLSKKIMEVMEESDKEFREGFISMTEYISAGANTPIHKLAKSVMRILIFTFMTDISWGVGYG